ncbi:hypothetical protein EPJ67_08670 [Brachyspira aalborgi]|uniref:Uncharacterized protein n=1 Tax=Brachyspira aalborgi TaxID=29522 RepID=A0A5C8G2N3_9SPIR|nr:MFS transporter [Brachyspira aalborgi]TXJ56312.1 hypothetical protein EPJ67_08670 [Brachyspira aalborgi]
MSRDLSNYRGDNRTFWERVKDGANSIGAFVWRVFMSIVTGLFLSIVFIIYKFSTNNVRTKGILETSFNFLQTLGGSLIIAIIILVFSPFVLYFIITYIPAIIGAIINKGDRISSQYGLLLSVILPLALIIGCIIGGNILYKPYKEMELERIEMSENTISDLLEQANYSQAFSSIENDIVWQANIPIINFGDIQRTKAKQKNEYKKLITSLINGLNEKNNLTMNNDTYNYIYNEILSTYENIVSLLNKKEQKNYDKRIEPALNLLDAKRHQFLEEQWESLNGMNKSEANSYLSGIYHNSDRTYSTKFKVINTSYKSYWNNRKKEYLNNL